MRPALSNDHRSLLMRANRLLGANLVETNLVKIDSLEAANERLLELVASGEPRQSTVLGILAYELKVLREEDVLLHIVDECGAGLIDLNGYEIPDDIRKTVDLGACWATWSLPFDHEEDVHYVATAYYLSPAVRTYWERILGGHVIWFGTTLEQLADAFERIDGERTGKPVVKTV
jgi:hypothetical protein